MIPPGGISLHVFNLTPPEALTGGSIEERMRPWDEGEASVTLPLEFPSLKPALTAHFFPE